MQLHIHLRPYLTRVAHNALGGGQKIDEGKIECFSPLVPFGLTAYDFTPSQPRFPLLIIRARIQRKF